MKNWIVTIMAASVLTILVVVIRQKAQAQNTGSQPTDNADVMVASVVETKSNNLESSPIFVTEIPPGYRDWKWISESHEEGNLNSFAAILGNDVAIEAYRAGQLPFPDGAIIASLHYHYVP